MFKKWFGGKKSPTNSGNPEFEGQLDGQNWKKVFEVQLSNMEDTPSYSLTHQLTVGSEIGNIIIADPSISPRHATFILQQEVVSVIDHASVAGTIVNGKKITPGKYIILEETDIIAMGDLEIRLIVTNEAVAAEPIPEVPSDKPELVIVPEPAPAVEPIVKIAKVPDKPKVLVNKLGTKTKGKGKLNLSLKSYYATNSLVRIMAVACDLLIAYAIIQVMMPFDDFRDLLTMIPKELSEILGLNWTEVWLTITEGYEPVRTVIEDVYQLVADSFHVLPLFIVFIFIRLLTTFMFGVSVSEFFLGVRPNGNKIWARFGGVLRVILGIFTGPLLILDAPSIVSRRTFKEFMTFTNTYLDSKFFAILGVILYFPLLIALNLVAPMFEGLELPEAILVSEKIDQRVRVVKPTGNEIVVDPASVVTMGSQNLGMEFPYSQAALSIIPEFKFQGISKKLKFKSQLVFYPKDIQRPVELELVKKFDLKQLLSLALSANYFLGERFPEIYNYVHEPVQANKSFRKVENEKTQAKFSAEVIDLIKLSFELNLENLLDVMQTQTPLIKGLVDFKDGLISLIEYKHYTSIGFIKIGNVVFMKVRYDEQRPNDILIPLSKGEGRMLRVRFDKKQKVGEIANHFYKYTLEKSNWMSLSPAAVGEVMNPLQVYDYFASADLKKKISDPVQAQALYGYYFEKSAQILAQTDAVEYEAWKKSIDGVVTILEKILKIKSTDLGESPSVKLLNNFKQIQEAVNTKNVNYFSPGQTI